MDYPSAVLWREAEKLSRAGRNTVRDGKLHALPDVYEFDGISTSGSVKSEEDLGVQSAGLLRDFSSIPQLL